MSRRRRTLCHHCWIDNIWRVLITEDSHEVLGSHHRHTRAGGHRGAPNVWHQDHVCKFAQRLWHVRLVLEDVQGSSGNPALLQRLNQRRFVHDRTTCRIDQIGRRPHHAEFCCPDEVRGGRRQGDMQADKIGLLQERVLLDPGGIEFGFDSAIQTLTIVVQDPHLKTFGAACYRLPNAPHTTDPQGPAMDITPGHEQQGPVAPLPSPDVAVAFGNTAGDATEQGPSEVCG